MGFDRKMLKQMQDMQANMMRAQQEVQESVVEGTDWRGHGHRAPQRPAGVGEREPGAGGG